MWYLWPQLLIFDLKKHIESVHDQKKPFKYDICDQTYYQYFDLKKHIKSVHEKKNPFKCEICDHISSQMSGL